MSLESLFSLKTDQTIALFGNKGGGKSGLSPRKISSEIAGKGSG